LPLSAAAAVETTAPQAVGVRAGFGEVDNAYQTGGLIEEN